MRIAMITLRADPTDGRMLRQLRTLEDAGFEPLLFPIFGDDAGGSIDTAKFAPPPMDTPLRPNARPRKFLPARANGFLAFRAARSKLIKLLDASTPDIILAHEPEPLAAVAQYAGQRFIPLVYDAHEFYADQRGATPARRKWVQRTHNEAARYISSFTTVSPGLAELYKTAHPSLPPAIIIPNAVEERPEAATYDFRLHKAAGFSPETKILLYQGGLWANRGLEDLIRIAPSMPSGWGVVAMGAGPFRSVLQNEPSIVVLDAKPQAELQHWTAGAALGLIPYHDDNLNHRHCWPNKLWEYPAAGVPIIARRLPDMCLKLDKSHFGVLIDHDAPAEDYVNKIEALTETDLIQLAQNAKKFASGDNWNSYKPLFVEIFDRFGKQVPKIKHS